MKGTTSGGFAFEVEAKALDNMELVDAIAESEEDPTRISRVCLLVLGKEQRGRLYDHLRTGDGRVPVQAVTDAVMEILTAFGQPGKN